MERYNIIKKIGEKYLTSNIENDEFSYPKAFDKEGINFKDVRNTNHEGRGFEKIDIRFTDKESKVSVLVETKQNFDKDSEAEKQLEAYVSYEKKLNNNHIIAILANTNDDRIKVWKNDVSEPNQLKSEYALKTFEEYVNMINPAKINNKEQVMKNTYYLNEMLHQDGISEKLRSQFVGTCLLALKKHLDYKSPNISTRMILAGIRGILTEMLSKNLNKAEKLLILDKKVLDDQDVRTLSSEELKKILSYIDNNILKYINEKTAQGQDILNLFFTTFNKYVGKTDKNQAFTPDHIADFMCKVVGINRHNRVLDPTAGSGTFLVRAMTDALNDCQTEEERNAVTESHIYGIEYEEGAFGLATTNMLIHSDGNSNVIQGSCFEKLDWIKNANIDRVLMNPPYNAQKKHCDPKYVKTWSSKKKEDPSKGFHYVYEIAKAVNKGRLAVLLPMQCAIGTDSEIKKFKQLMLQEHHLDAVFSLPPDIFHPGASANACCMIFDLGVRHESAPIKETFFGYFKDDGFVKKKNIGRVEKIDPTTGKGVWKDIEKKWLDAYFHRKTIPGLSVTKKVTYEDEWLCEAYMETDYSKLSQNDFEESVRNFYAYCISSRNENYAK